MGNDDYGELDLDAIVPRTSEENRKKMEARARRLKDPRTRDAARAELDAICEAAKGTPRSPDDARSRHFIDSSTPGWYLMRTGRGIGNDGKDGPV